MIHFSRLSDAAQFQADYIASIDFATNPEGDWKHVLHSIVLGENVVYGFPDEASAMGW